MPTTQDTDSRGLRGRLNRRAAAPCGAIFNAVPHFASLSPTPFFPITLFRPHTALGLVISSGLSTKSFIILQRPPASTLITRKRVTALLRRADSRNPVALVASTRFGRCISLTLNAATSYMSAKRSQGVSIFDLAGGETRPVGVLIDAHDRQALTLLLVPPNAPGSGVGRLFDSSRSLGRDATRPRSFRRGRRGGRRPIDARWQSLRQWNVLRDSSRQYLCRIRAMRRRSRVSRPKSSSRRCWQ
jgi:hypothetical protein